MTGRKAGGKGAGQVSRANPCRQQAQHSSAIGSVIPLARDDWRIGTLNSGVAVDKRFVPDLTKMWHAARTAGVSARF